MKNKAWQNAKEQHKHVWMCMQADGKTSQGGISEIARTMGIDPKSLANALSPNHERMISFPMFLEFLALSGGTRTVSALASLVNQTAIDLDIDHEALNTKCAVTEFLSLVNRISHVMGEGSKAAQDGRFDAQERQQLDPLLTELMRQVAILLYSIRGA